MPIEGKKIHTATGEEEPLFDRPVTDMPRRVAKNYSTGKSVIVERALGDIGGYVYEVDDLETSGAIPATYRSGLVKSITTFGHVEHRITQKNGEEIILQFTHDTDRHARPVSGELGSAAPTHEFDVLDPSWEEIVKTDREVLARIDEMAAEITERYGDKNPLFVCLLRGGVLFTATLMKSIARQDPLFHPEVDYMTISTYGREHDARESRIVMDLAPSTEVKNRTVVVLDDVLDQGHTAVFAHDYLMGNGAKSVDHIVLVQKDVDRPYFPTATMYGFEAPDKWLLGWGMDDSVEVVEGFRWIGSIAVAKK